ncbi:MAG: hypothetical protein WAJ93_05235 [Candidatus Nitrosopolaris sp.]
MPINLEWINIRIVAGIMLTTNNTITPNSHGLDIRAVYSLQFLPPTR